jgi:hypothetical protein
MRTRTFQDVLKAVCAHRGHAFTTTYLESRPDLAQFVNDRLRHAWHFAWWRDLLVIEQRRYRPVYAAGTTYAAGREVYKLNADSETIYYRSMVGSNVGNDPETDDGTHWLPVADVTDDDVSGYVFAPFIATDPADEDSDGGAAIGEKVWSVCDANPRLPAGPGNVYDFVLGSDAVHVRGDGYPAAPWVAYLPPCPIFSTELWVAGAYAADAIVFYATTKECWRSTGAAEGDIPGTSAKWVKVEFPAVLFDFVTRAAYCDFVRADGMNGQEAEAVRRKVNDVEEGAEERLHEAAMLHAES